MTRVKASISGALVLGIVGALLLVPGCGDEHSDAIVANLAEDLLVFSYQQTSGLGFCPQVGSVGAARIEVDANGELECSILVVEPGNRTTGECLTPVNDGSCLVLREVVRRTLTQSERRALLGAFRAVKIGTKSDPNCGTYDPCVVRQFYWIQSGDPPFERSTFAYDGPCAPRLPPSEVAEIEGILQDIRGQ